MTPGRAVGYSLAWILFESKQRDASAEGLRARVAAFRHFMTSGWRQGDDPCSWFSTRDYLAANPDVQASGQNPFIHYLARGRTEGRRLWPGADRPTARRLGGW